MTVSHETKYWQQPFAFDPLTDRISDAEKRPIAAVFVGLQYTDEQVRTGYVLAAGSDLLAELREIVEGWEQIEQGKVKMRRLTAWEEERLEFARAAIARATGGAA